jgi:putative glycosyltransferase (TIGR04348 family)
MSTARLKKILLITPAKPGSRHGNRNTAVRWARLLRELGYGVTIDTGWKPAYSGRFQAMIGLHARRSHESLLAWRQSEGAKPLVLALTGTDLYRDIRVDAAAQRSLDLADRMIVLQAEGLRELAPRHRAKTDVIMQSVEPVQRRECPKRTVLITVIGHLREEKDPFRTAAALAHVPDLPQLRVVQLGGAMSPEMEQTAQAWMAREPRYRWLGELPHGRTMQWLARSHAMVISSRMEGGAHVVSEAIDAGVAVLASKISGNLGMLGRDYGGYYPVEDDRALARRLRQIVEDPSYLHRLAAQTQARRSLITRNAEKLGLKNLMKRAFSGQ